MNFNFKDMQLTMDGEIKDEDEQSLKINISLDQKHLDQTNEWIGYYLDNQTKQSHKLHINNVQIFGQSKNKGEISGEG